MGSRGFPSAARVGGADGGGDRGGGRHRPAKSGPARTVLRSAGDCVGVGSAPARAHSRTAHDQSHSQRHAGTPSGSAPTCAKLPLSDLVGRPAGQGGHQMDFVGPCYLTGPVRFYSLHSVDLATGRCAIEPVLGRSSQITLEAVWAMWRRLGDPAAPASRQRHGVLWQSDVSAWMGPRIRLCLAHDVEPWFIPLAEPWRNGVVERFNACWQQHGPLRHPLRTFRALQTRVSPSNSGTTAAIATANLAAARPMPPSRLPTYGWYFPAAGWSPTIRSPNPARRAIT